MTSKNKLRLGAAVGALLISFSGFVGCKQAESTKEILPDYTVTVGVFSDTTFRDGDSVIHFGKAGKFTVENFTFTDKDVEYTITQEDLKEARYSVSSGVPQLEMVLARDIIGKNSTDENVTMAAKGTDKTPVKVSFNQGNDVYTLTMAGYRYELDQRPSNRSAFVGSYKNDNGVEVIKINDDGTFYQYDQGGKTVQFWRYNPANNTITVADTMSGTISGGQEYSVLPHALISSSSSEIYWK